MIIPLDLPDELIQHLEKSAKEQGLSFREFVMASLHGAVNSASTRSPRPPRRFSQKVHDFGTHLEGPWTVLSEIETEDYISRYREIRK